MKYLPLFLHFKAFYQFPKHIFFWVKIVALTKKQEKEIRVEVVWKKKSPHNNQKF
jgi:hypothetical protein